MIWNTVAYIYNNHCVQKMIEQIERENVLNRDIEVHHVPIDQVFSQGFYGNTFISGGLKEVRSAFLYAGINSSFTPFIIIHNSDTELVNRLFGVRSIIISAGTNNYDPFYLKEDSEIINLIIESAATSYGMQFNAEDYIKGMLMFLHSKEIAPTLHRLATCPHNDLIKNIKTRVNNGEMDQELGRKITTLLNSGQSERFRIEKYFRDLERECKNILYMPPRGNCYDIKQAIKDKKNIIIDLNGTNHSNLLNLIITQVKMMEQSSNNVRIILDDIHIDTGNKVIRDLIYTMYTEVIVTGDDLLSLFQNDEALFKTVYSKSNQKMILNQCNGISAKYYSEYVGTFKKKEIKETIPETVFQLSNPIPLGVPKTHLVEERDEPKITENELQNLGNNGSYYYDLSLSKWKNFILE